VTLSATATVTDGDNDTATATVTADLGGNISFDDDVPVINSIKNAIVANTTGSVTGSINVDFGADGPNATTALIIAAYDDLPGIVEVLSADSQTLTAYIDTDNDGIHDAGEIEEFYRLTLDDAGRTYTLTYNERPVVSTELDFNAASGGGGDETLIVPAGDYELTFNGGVFNGTTLVDLGEGESGDDNDDVKPTGTGFGIGGTTGQTTIEDNEGFFVSVASGGAPSTADGLTFEIDRNGGGGTTTMVVNWRAFDADGNLIVGGAGFNAGSGSETFTVVKSPATGFVTINPPGEFETMEVWFTDQSGSGNVRIEGVQLIATVIPENQPLSFDIGAVDGDGDLSGVAALDVLLQGGEGPDYVLSGTADDEILVGGSGDDVLVGAAGSDELIGGAGADTFVIGADSMSLAIDDLIVDFESGAAGDTIDLTELLSGVAAGTDLESSGHVSVVQNGPDAELKVDQNGGGDEYQTVAVLENFVFNNASEAIKILYDTGSGTASDVV
jgi:Ca2+-binding RTX toxin-like protein